MSRVGWRSETGAAAVEFAMVLPLLMLLIVGMLEWGRYFIVRESVIHAAREGARGGTLLDATEADACAAASAFLTNVGVRAGCAGGGITVDMNQSIPGGSMAIPAVQVQLDIEFRTITGLPLFVPTTMHVEAVMPSWNTPAGGGG